MSNSKLYEDAKKIHSYGRFIRNNIVYVFDFRYLSIDIFAWKINTPDLVWHFDLVHGHVINANVPNKPLTPMMIKVFMEECLKNIENNCQNTKIIFPKQIQNYPIIEITINDQKYVLNLQTIIKINLDNATLPFSAEIQKEILDLKING